VALSDWVAARSPCVAICRLEQEICIGCGRTRQEIAAWPSLDLEGERTVNAAAAQRRARLGLPKTQPGRRGMR